MGTHRAFQLHGFAAARSVLPPSMRVTLTTSDSSELKLRLGSVCSAPTIWLAVTMVSTPCSGLVAWAPLPVMRIWKRSALA